MAAAAKTGAMLGPAALYYATQFGWAVFPLHSAIAKGRCSCRRPDCGNVGKHPRTEHGFHDASRDPAVIKAWWEKWPDANIGIATGAVSGFIALDVDPRNGGEESLDTIIEQKGRLPDSVQSRTGGGGDHYLFAYPADLPSGREVPSGKLVAGIDIKADGGYIVAPPSVHSSGRPYSWEASSRPGEVALAPAPSWLLERVVTDRARYEGPSGDLDASFFHLAFGAAGWLHSRIDVDRVAVTCPWAHEHTSGRDGDTSTILFAPAAGHTLGWFHCSHSHCGGRTADEVRRSLPPDAVAAANAKQRATAASVDPNAASGPVPVAAAAAAPADWRALLARNKQLEAKTTYGNVCLILRNTYGSRLTYNEMRVAPMLDGVALRDGDVGRIREELERAWGITPSAENVAAAILQVAEERRFHPVRDYLTALAWDGECRIDRVASEVLGAEASELTTRLLRCWFVSAVARAMRPGCKVDTALVLVGDQGFLKSTFFAELGGPFFSDTAMDISSKDGLLQLAYAWIYEWAELENVTTKKQASDVKAFITSRTDTFRPPYGRGIIQHQRSTVIVGSTNEEQFLNDATGSRRFWVIRVRQRVNIELLRQWRDQLWAEALAAFESGYAWWLEAAEEAERERGADEHRVEDAIELAIAAWTDDVEAKRLMTERQVIMDGGYITTGDVLERVLKLDPGRWDRGIQTRIGHAMHRLGWRKDRVRRDGGRLWVFKPPTVMTQPHSTAAQRHGS
jgi:hypothetical protein